MANSQTSTGRFEPINTRLGEVPTVLNDEPDLQHAWKVANWVYDTQDRIRGLPKGSPYSNRLKKDIPKQTAGILLVALVILHDVAYKKYNDGKRANSAVGIKSDLAVDAWGRIFIAVCRRMAYVLEKQPQVAASMKSYQKPSSVAMLFGTCQRAMDGLRNENMVVGVMALDANKELLPEILDWWMLLQIALVRVPNATDITTEKSCAANISNLKNMIEKAK